MLFLRFSCSRNSAAAQRCHFRHHRRVDSGASALLFCLMFIANSVSAADTWPSRPLRLILPYGAGGSYDAIARVIAGQAGEQIGQQIIVDNRPGAAGRIGMEAAVKSQADGYTLVVIGNSQAIVPSVHLNVPYDLARDLDYVSMVATVTNAVVIHPGVPVNTIKEFVALSRAKPGSLRFGSGGAGSSGHLAGELFRSMSGADITHIPYKSAALATTALLGNEVQVYIANLVNAVPQIQSSRLRALAVTSLQRSTMLPGVPTLDETVAKGYEMVEFHGIAAPRGTPSAVVVRLNQEIEKALASPDIRTRLAGQGAEPAASKPQAFRQFVLAEKDKLARIVQTIGLKPID